MPNRRAFTYVELTIVLTIICILAAIAVPNFLEAQKRSLVSRGKADMAILKMAVEAYRLENKVYPQNRNAGKPDAWDLVALTTPVVYISHLPPDVFTSEESRPSRHAPAMTPVPYHYLNGIQMDPENGLKIQSPDQALSTGFTAGLLWGRGPSWRWGEPEKTVTLIREKGVVDILPYDATNGTTSLGEIYLRIP